MIRTSQKKGRTVGTNGGGAGGGSVGSDVGAVSQQQLPFKRRVVGQASRPQALAPSGVSSLFPHCALHVPLDGRREGLHLLVRYLTIQHGVCIF